MIKNKSICVVVPTYNEEKLIGRVIKSMPDLVDRIIIVDDNSKDNTVEIVKGYCSKNPEKIMLICHENNQGVGATISTGYKKAVELKYDVTLVMAGDAQMDPADLPTVAMPVVENKADYVKGNRLFSGESWGMIPHYRYLGNSALSFLTKIASGYWHIADSQTGYTAISLETLRKIDIDSIYKSYGMPNDVLVTLNIHNCVAVDVPIKPVYNIGEKSGIKLYKVIPSISKLLIKGFFKRMLIKYVIKDFHPLVLFYLLAFFALPLSFLFLFRTIYFYFILGSIPHTSFLIFWFLLISGFQSLFFAMWFDMDYNKKLK